MMIKNTTPLAPSSLSLKRSAGLLISFTFLIAALFSVMMTASAQAAPQQVTNWGINISSTSGRFGMVATNPNTGGGLAVSFYHDGSTAHWVAIPLSSAGTASGPQTVLLSGAEVTVNANPAVKYDPVSGDWVACLGNYSTKTFQCWFLNGDGTIKAGSPFVVSTGADGGLNNWDDYYNISIAYSAKAGKWLAAFNDYYNTATNWLDSSGAVTRGLDLITDGSGQGGLDLAYSPKSDKFMLVNRWRVAPDTQDGGYVWHLNGDGTLLSGPTRVGDGAINYKNPVMAYNAVRDEFLVANFANSGPSLGALATQSYSASGGVSAGETLSTITSSTSTFTTFRNRVAIAAPNYGDSFKVVTPLRIDGTSDYGNYSLSLDGAGVIVGEPDALIGPSAALGNSQRPRVAFNQATCSYLSTYNSPVGDPITSWELFSSVIPATDPCKYGLTVTKTGAGSGTVAGGGVSCGTTCSSEETAGSEVTLTAVADSGSKFDGWSGGNAACSGTGSCIVSMTGARSVTAAFSSTTIKYALTVAKTGAGSGTVAGGGISCGTTCSSEELAGSEVTLTAVAVEGSQFDGWSEACSGTGSCVVSMTEARSVTAAFSATTPTPIPSNKFILSPVLKNNSSLLSVIVVKGPGVAIQLGTFNRSSVARSTKRVKACQDSLKITKAGRYKLSCKLTAAARSARRNGSIRVTLTTTFKPTGGSARTVTRVVKLKQTSNGITG